MAALRMVARAARRHQAAGLVVVAMVVGIAGGAVLAATAGARRTASTLERFRTETRAADVELDITEATPAQIVELRAHPAVASVARLRQVMLAAPDAGPTGGYFPTVAATDSAFGRVVDRSRLLEGRRADPGAVDELEVGESTARELGLSVGETFALGSYSPEQTAAAARGEEVGAPAGPTVGFRVVGIVRRPLDLGISGASGGAIVTTPAFHDRYRNEIGGFVDALLRVRATEGDAGVPEVVRAARAVFGDDLFMVIGVSDETAGVAEAIDVQERALWAFAAIGVLATATVSAIVLVRQLGTREPEQSVLAAIGLTRRQRALATAVVAVPSAAVGGGLAVAVAVAVSPLIPFGVARAAEPAPGVAVDLPVVTLGFAAIVGFLLSVAVLAGWRIAGAPARERRDPDRARPTLAARAASATGSPPALTTGLRLAFEPGRGRGAVPVRSALVGAALGTVGVSAVLVFSASLHHLVDTPRLYGWGWDATITPHAEPQPGTSGRCTDVDIAHDPAVRAVGAICLESVAVDGRPVTGWFLEARRGRLVPVVVDGRPPAVDDEVVLGSATLAALGKGVGDTVRVRGEAARRFRIVGRSVFPHLSDEDSDPISEGALFTGPAMTRLFAPITAPNRYLVASFAPDDARAAPEEGGTVALRTGTGTLPRPPDEVARIVQVDHVPGLLGALLALLGTVSVAHVVVAGVQRRRRELAILRAIGFTDRDVRATVAYQASIVGVVALAIGIPVGIVVGRTVWLSIADGIGAVPEVAVPWLGLALTAFATIVVVNVIGAVGARLAVRDRPADVLATE